MENRVPYMRVVPKTAPHLEEEIMAALKYFFILGAPDPEMGAIEFVLTQRNYIYGSGFTYAVDRSGKRVYHGSAYRAVTTQSPIPQDPNIKIVVVECSISSLNHIVKDDARLVRIDHHNPGDYGFDFPPEKYWEASSIGQVCNLIHYPVADSLLLSAAADHCLLPAYAGKCPGVDPENLLRYRARSRAKTQNRSLEDVLRDINIARGILRSASRIKIAGYEVADMRTQKVPELPEAASRENIPYVAIGKDKNDFRKKLVLWSAPPMVVTAFMEEHMGEECYGDPLRGFAGVYLEDKRNKFA